jgi:hypothetical protein
MTFPSGSTINEWFQSAHCDALAVGGSVYNMEKLAEEQLVKTVLRWSYANLITELEQLGYRDRSRVVIHIQQLSNDLYDVKQEDSEEFTDDYEDQEEEEEEVQAYELISKDEFHSDQVEILNALEQASLQFTDLISELVENQKAKHK